MKGADQCPKCASRKWVDIEQPVTKFYARKIRVCGNCRAAWEPFTPDQLLDDDSLSSFIEPCDNCAFRPGSHEQQDTEAWRKTMEMLKAGGMFFCHKGVPIDVHSEGGDGFHYPTRKVDTPEGPQEIKNIRKMRLCRGYLNMMDRILTRAWEEKHASTDDSPDLRRDADRSPGGDPARGAEPEGCERSEGRR